MTRDLRTKMVSSRGIGPPFRHSGESRNPGGGRGNVARSMTTRGGGLSPAGVGVRRNRIHRANSLYQAHSHTLECRRPHTREPHSPAGRRRRQTRPVLGNECPAHHQGGACRPAGRQRVRRALAAQTRPPLPIQPDRQSAQSGGVQNPGRTRRRLMERPAAPCCRVSCGLQ